MANVKNKLSHTNSDILQGYMRKKKLFGSKPIQFFEFGKMSLQFVFLRSIITTSSFSHPYHFLHGRWALVH
jgi:hypothetical protein